MIQALCWTLIHSLWQGLIFGVITGLVMLYTKRSTAALRYGIVSGLFFLFLVACACTFGWEWSLREQKANGWQYLVSGGGRGSWMLAMTDYLSVHASFIVTLWCLLLLARSVRMLSGILYMQRTRNLGTVAPPAYWRDKIIALCGQAGVSRTVRLLESRIARMPMVIGHLKPVILIPLGLLTKLPEGEIEAVLLHELAHIRRNDYLVNFLQHIAENLFFFNPGLMWMSAILREERENCCDDLAIAKTKDKVQFIQALISFKEYALQVPVYALAFPAKKNQLLYRTMRIVHDRNKTLNPAEKIFFLGSWIVLLCLFVAWADGPGPVMDNRNNDALPAVAENRIVSRITQMGNVPFMTDNAGLQAENETAVVFDQSGEVAQTGVDEQQAGADEARIDEQQRKVDAEGVRVDQLQAQVDAEGARMDQLQAQADAEQARKDAEQAKKDAEQARKDEEQARKDAEQARQDGVQAKMDADREQAEDEQQVKIDAEQARAAFAKQASRDKQQAKAVTAVQAKAMAAVQAVRIILR